MEFKWLLTTSQNLMLSQPMVQDPLKTPWHRIPKWLLLSHWPQFQDSKEGRKVFFPFLSAQEQRQLQTLLIKFLKCPLNIRKSFSDITRRISQYSPHLLVFICLAESHPAPGFSSLLSWTMRVFFFIIFIISNVFHKLDLKRENSPPYFRSDYQMMMDNRLIRVAQGDTSSCV